MKTPVRFAVSALALFAVVTFLQAGPTAAQAPEEPKNLKVLPKDMPRREVIAIMRNFSSALGVKCDECHAASKTRPDDLDFASDEKPEKEEARKMMKLVGSINDQIAQAGFKDAPQVRCITCHRGVKRPETLAARLTRVTDKGGADAAVAEYRKLRDRYYGTGSYDFSPASLSEVAGQLAESKKDYDGAIKLLQLNLEFSPKDAESYVVLGRAQMAKGDRAAAVASLEKALALDPNNRWAKQMLERAKGGQ